MDPQSISDLAQKIADAEVHINLTKYIYQLLISVASIGFTGWIAYHVATKKKQAELDFTEANMARIIAAAVRQAEADAIAKKNSEIEGIQQNIQTILDQLKATTQTTEDIKSQFSRREWADREYRTLRREKLEEILGYAWEFGDALPRLLHDQSSQTFNKLDFLNYKTRIIHALYFPELTAEITLLIQQTMDFKVCILDANGFDQQKATLEKHQKPLWECISNLQEAARGIFPSIVNV